MKKEKCARCKKELILVEIIIDGILTSNIECPKCKAILTIDNIKEAEKYEKYLRKKGKVKFIGEVN